MKQEYRTVHQDADHARLYDADFWTTTSAKGLNWSLEQRLLDRIFADDLPRAPRTAIDFACGTGRVLRYLEGRVDQTIGIDISAEMLALAAPRCRRSQLIQHDVTHSQLSSLPRPVDLVTAFRFFLNAEPQLRRDSLDWVRSVLAPDGLLVANFHLNPCSLRGSYLQARWAGGRRMPMISRVEAEAMLRDCGFGVVGCYGYDFLPYRRDGERLRAPRTRRRIESALLDRASLSGLGGSFLLLARPR